LRATVPQVGAKYKRATTTDGGLHPEIPKTVKHPRESHDSDGDFMGSDNKRFETTAAINAGDAVRDELRAR